MGFKDLGKNCNNSKDKKSPSVEAAKELAPNKQNNQKAKNK